MYTTTRNDLETFLSMDVFWNPGTSLEALVAALESDNWQVQQAALAALGDRAESAALTAIEALLAQQDTLGVYDCPEEWDLDAAANAAEREAWRCRFRVKQAALIAIGKMVATCGPDIVGEPLFSRVKRYAVSQEDDYAVRVAACDLLGKLGRPEAVETLKQATGDGEWCTATTARKSLLKQSVYNSRSK